VKKIALISLFISFIIPAFSSEPGKGVYWGAFIGAAPAIASSAQYKKLAGKKMAQVMWYLDWASDFPSALVSGLSKAGYISHITWEPWYWADKTKVITLDNIINGGFDNYIKKFAKAAASSGVVVFLRPMHEFNGDWYPWSIKNNGQDPEKFKKAWIHMHDIFSKAGAQNVQWIWSPNASTLPDYGWNDPMLSYPGDDYVDWLGIDGYNFGSYQSWSSWLSFEDVFLPMYKRLTGVITLKPVMISEFACADRDGDKAKWISSLETGLRKFPAIRAITWFDMKKEMDWRINSSPGALKAFNETVSSPYFLSSGSGLGLVSKLYSPVAGARRPPIDTGKKVSITARAMPDIKIDGEPDASIKTLPALIYGRSKKIPAAKISVGFDSMNVYVFAEVSDARGVNAGSGDGIRGGDCVELCFSMSPDADPSRLNFTDGDYHIGIKASPEPEGWNWTAQAPLDRALIVYKKKNRGYALEALIPWYNLNRGCFCRIRDRALLFDCAVDYSGPVRRQFRWTGGEEFYRDPSEWGVVVFSSEP
jgi:hypothetical protein